MSDNNDDEIITVQLPRSQYKLLREIIKREETYSYIGKKLTSLWVWAFAGGVMTVWALWDKFNGAISGAIK